MTFAGVQFFKWTQRLPVTLIALQFCKLTQRLPVTSQSCMLAATLISTVAFAAAFTVPGGNYNGDDRNINGLPILLNWSSFIVFAVADALALFSSVTSVLMFLAILTSPYSEEDFLKALPQKFILGLATLFFSIATMMISFGSAVDIMLCQRLTWIIVPIALLGCVPVTLFVWLLFPLFVEMIHATYWPFHLKSIESGTATTFLPQFLTDGLFGWIIPSLKIMADLSTF